MKQALRANRITLHTLPFTLVILIMILSACKADKYDSFWNWFSEHEDALYHYNGKDEKTADALSMQLKKIDQNLSFEMNSTPTHNDLREISISAQGVKASFPSVLKLVEKAPKLSRWKVNAFRQRTRSNEISITLNNHISIACSDIFFLYRLNNEKIDLKLYVRNYRNDQQADRAIYILMDALIGEYDMETRIGAIEMEKLHLPDSLSMRKLVMLRQLVDSLKKHDAAAKVQPCRGHQS